MEKRYGMEIVLDFGDTLLIRMGHCEDDKKAILGTDYYITDRSYNILAHLELKEYHEKPLYKNVDNDIDYEDFIKGHWDYYLTEIDDERNTVHCMGFNEEGI